MATLTANLTDRLGFMGITELCAVLNISRPSAYALLAQGKLPYLKIGRVYRVPRRAVADLIEEAGK